MPQTNEQGEAMNTLLSDEELMDVVIKLVIDIQVQEKSANHGAELLLDLINTQKRLYAEMVIGKDETKNIKGTHFYKANIKNIEIRNWLRANQKARIK